VLYNFSKSSKETDMMDENKQKSLDLAMKQIDKAFGKGTLMRLGDKPTETIESISTGSIGIDLALGIGGVPEGRVIEIYGPESSGKTTLTLQIIAEFCRAYDRVDVEANGLALLDHSK